jgi:16S rRNA (cytosine967-C5)-methyltransferase
MSTRSQLTGQARVLALQIAAEIRSDWTFATDVMARAFRTHRGLPSRDRRAIAEAVYGLLRFDRLLDAIVDEALARNRGPRRGLSPEARDEVKLTVLELRQGLMPADENTRATLDRIFGFVVPVETLVAEDAGLARSSGLDREALKLSFPTWIFERFVEDMGPAGATALCASMNLRAPLTVMANTRMIDRHALAARLSTEGVESHPTPLASAGLVFDTRINAFGLPAFQEGLFEVMDEGSQLVAEVVAPPPSARVLDACAGAGGKTLALGALLGGKGTLLALDVSGKKLEELRRRARRAGLSNVRALAVEDGAPLPSEVATARWDRVLVDAPCSGLGTLRRNPEARWRLSAKDLAVLPARQLVLLVTYAPCVAVGGRLIYATCTILSSENDRVVERFLAERPEFQRVPLKEILGRERAERLGDGLCLRLHPHTHETDGFFATVLRRVS